MDYESRFSLVRWTMTVVPVWLAFTNYFTLQAYLLKLYEPSTEYINDGWNSWYLTLFVGALLAISLNVLMWRFKDVVGAAQALKISCPLLIFMPSFIIFRHQLNLSGDANGNTFFHYSFSVALIITLVLHAILFFYKNKNDSPKLM